jgi:hypothetical protein
MPPGAKHGETQLVGSGSVAHPVVPASQGQLKVPAHVCNESGCCTYVPERSPAGGAIPHPMLMPVGKGIGYPLLADPPVLAAPLIDTLPVLAAPADPVAPPLAETPEDGAPAALAPLEEPAVDPMPLLPL